MSCHSAALNRSSMIAFSLYVAIGSLGAMTMRDVTDNMLQAMMSGAFGPITEVASMTFAFFIIGLGIPLFRFVELLSFLYFFSLSCPLSQNVQSVLYTFPR